MNQHSIVKADKFNSGESSTDIYESFPEKLMAVWLKEQIKKHCRIKNNKDNRKYFLI
jgi:hypothetical protein